jgi:hypothetical protein
MSRFVSTWPVLFLLLQVSGTMSGAAGPLDHRFDVGLVYHRVHRLPADLPARLEDPPPACIVDLRFVDADGPAAAAFGAWLKFRATLRSPVFVLVNTRTSAPLLRVLRARAQRTGAVVIGPSATGAEPDLIVTPSPVEEERAYAAVEHGALPEAVITDHPGKLRNDEASLNREHAGVPSPEEPLRPGAASSEVADAALQRAVHFHRALQALGRL